MGKSFLSWGRHSSKSSDPTSSAASPPRPVISSPVPAHISSTSHASALQPAQHQQDADVTARSLSPPLAGRGLTRSASVGKPGPSASSSSSTSLTGVFKKSSRSNAAASDQASIHSVASATPGPHMTGSLSKNHRFPSSASSPALSGAPIPSSPSITISHPSPTPSPVIGSPASPTVSGLRIRVFIDHPTTEPFYISLVPGVETLRSIKHRILKTDNDRFAQFRQQRISPVELTWDIAPTPLDDPSATSFDLDHRIELFRVSVDWLAVSKTKRNFDKTRTYVPILSAHPSSAVLARDPTAPLDLDALFPPSSAAAEARIKGVVELVVRIVPGPGSVPCLVSYSDMPDAPVLVDIQQGATVAQVKDTIGHARSLAVRSVGGGSNALSPDEFHLFKSSQLRHGAGKLPYDIDHFEGLAPETVFDDEDADFFTHPSVKRSGWDRPEKWMASIELVAFLLNDMEDEFRDSLRVRPTQRFETTSLGSHRSYKSHAFSVVGSPASSISSRRPVSSPVPARQPLPQARSGAQSAGSRSPHHGKHQVSSSSPSGSPRIGSPTSSRPSSRASAAAHSPVLQQKASPRHPSPHGQRPDLYRSHSSSSNFSAHRQLGAAPNQQPLQDVVETREPLAMPQHQEESDASDYDDPPPPRRPSPRAVRPNSLPALQASGSSTGSTSSDSSVELVTPPSIVIAPSPNLTFGSLDTDLVETGLIRKTPRADSNDSLGLNLGGAEPRKQSLVLTEQEAEEQRQREEAGTFAVVSEEEEVKQVAPQKQTFSSPGPDQTPFSVQIVKRAFVRPGSQPDSSSFYSHDEISPTSVPVELPPCRPQATAAVSVPSPSPTNIPPPSTSSQTAFASVEALLGLGAPIVLSRQETSRPLAQPALNAAAESLVPSVLRPAPVKPASTVPPANAAASTPPSRAKATGGTHSASPLPPLKTPPRAPATSARLRFASVTLTSPPLRSTPKPASFPGGAPRPPLAPYRRPSFFRSPSSGSHVPLRSALKGSKRSAASSSAGARRPSGAFRRCSSTANSNAVPSSSSSSAHRSPSPTCSVNSTATVVPSSSQAARDRERSRGQRPSDRPSSGSSSSSWEEESVASELGIKGWQPASDDKDRRRRRSDDSSVSQMGPPVSELIKEGFAIIEGAMFKLEMRPMDARARAIMASSAFKSAGPLFAVSPISPSVV